MSKHSNDTARERIIVNEDGADLNRDIVTREVVAPPAPARMVGPARGEFEDARRAFVVELPGGRRKRAA